ncbi:MAG: hypothetical protein ACXVUE_18885 [Solirubrobacteraceae bacterium]
MGYKLLGYAVWQTAKWYVRGYAPGQSRKPSTRTVAIAGVGGAVLAGAFVAQRRITAD